jgi:hypothetical protein
MIDNREQPLKLKKSGFTVDEFGRSRAATETIVIIDQKKKKRKKERLNVKRETSDR